MYLVTSVTDEPHSSYNIGIILYKNGWLEVVVHIKICNQRKSNGIEQYHKVFEVIE